MLGEGCHILRCASPLLPFLEREGLPPADKLPFNPFSFGGPPHASLPFPRGQLRVAWRNFAGCPRLADLVGVAGVGRHNIN